MYAPPVLVQVSRQDAPSRRSAALFVNAQPNRHRYIRPATI
jgi:hypothetical protein